MSNYSIKSNDSIRLRVFCFEKAIYHKNVYCGNLRDGYYFHRQNNDKRIKVNKD